MRRLFSLLLLLHAVLYADDVYLKNGYMWKNLQLLDTVGNVINFQGTNESISLRITDIIRIVKKQYDPKAPSSFVSYVADTQGQTMPAETIRVDNSYPERVSAYPNAHLFPISIIAFALSWDYFLDVQDIDKTIADYERLKVDVSDLKLTKGRKTVFAVSFLLAGLLNTYFVFQRVEVSASPNSVSVKLHF